MEKRNTNDELKISYFLHEGFMVRLQRSHKWALIALCVIIAMLIGYSCVETVLRYRENRAWLDYLSQYDFTDYEFAQDGRGINIIGNMNGVGMDGPASEDTDTYQEKPQYGKGTGNP